MQYPESEQDRSAYTISVRRRLSNMRETLGVGRVPDTANENTATTEPKPGEPKAP